MADEVEQTHDTDAGAADVTGAAGPGAQPPAPASGRRGRRGSRAVRPRGPRTPEERQAERDAARRAKAHARRLERQRQRAKAAEAPSTAQATTPREHAPGVQKTRQGIVVSDRADKTIVVRIDVARRHRRYQKIVRTSTKLHAHDERNEARIGDTVVVREARPLSRTKHWRLLRIVERAQ